MSCLRPSLYKFHIPYSVADHVSSIGFKLWAEGRHSKDLRTFFLQIEDLTHPTIAHGDFAVQFDTNHSSVRNRLHPMVADINHPRCLEVAKMLRGKSIPTPTEDVPRLPFSPADEANFWFFLAAICHQTSPLGEAPLSGEINDTTKRGWDFLLHTFRAAAIDDLGWLRPERWAECTGSDLQKLFGPLLSRPDRRANLIRDLAAKLSDRGWASVIEAGPYCDFRISVNSQSRPFAAGGDTNEPAADLLGVLSDFEAFSDPVQKKSAFFLALMKNAGAWSYRDESQLPAPVDYHEIRGHLRIGTVVLAQEIRQKISDGCLIAAAEDIAIRFAVRDAIQVISGELSSSPNALHYFFWNLFRTYCLRDAPVCDGRHYSVLPPIYQQLVTGGGDCRCPFRTVCDSADRSNAINEPIVVTECY